MAIYFLSRSCIILDCLHWLLHPLDVYMIFASFGDKDLDLRLANPLHLRSVLEDKRFTNCRIVLLHASYPFSKEASYLSSVYNQVHLKTFIWFDLQLLCVPLTCELLKDISIPPYQVYLDFGLAIPKLSVHGMISSVKELLELAPIKKVTLALPEALKVEC